MNEAHSLDASIQTHSLKLEKKNVFYYKRGAEKVLFV